MYAVVRVIAPDSAGDLAIVRWPYTPADDEVVSGPTDGPFETKEEADHALLKRVGAIR